ncbi:hypothetical protein RGR602_CH00261 [Rhizobium gallicum bv. gallicum R602sp]|uniref:Uncharacterized protein n=1 Tax=Rhizobium gallicum bv. gallicum R602sp TaxID=1041138 RepID=A0A0B4WZ78_9HYPH|nr:hypothetical protein RGR602_CH00261 [Rhizobium gallicum bv. gallicum R602sp]TDW37304.1 hypothetical protein EV128_101781 [Rhizobium azibense]
MRFAKQCIFARRRLLRSHQKEHHKLGRKAVFGSSDSERLGIREIKRLLMSADEVGRVGDEIAAEPDLLFQGL